mgnify:CR=1 FL=1
MATIIVFVSLGVSAGAYALFSAIKAKRDHNKNKKSAYHNKVVEYTVKRGYPISNNYDNLEKRLANGEQLKPHRNPMENPVYRDIKEINDKLVLENPNRVPLYRTQPNDSDYQQV